MLLIALLGVACDASSGGSDAAASADAGSPGSDGSSPADASSATDALPGADATATEDAGPAGDAYVPSPELTQLLTEIARARQGTPADFDGDGRAELTRTVDPDGTIHTSIDVDGDGAPDFLYLFRPDGSGSLASDGDGDGTPEVEATFTAGPPRTRLFVRDRNANGFFDRRTLETYSSTTVELRLEIDPEEDGTFTSSLTVTEPLWVFAGTGCTDQQTFGDFPPSDAPAVIVTEHMRVLYGSGAGACTLAEARNVASALDRAVRRALSCVANNNSELAGLLSEALASDRNVTVACGNNCAPLAASTDCTNGCNETRINLNRARLPSDLDQLSNTMLHELFHWAGGGREADHDQGRDAVYSCARYCNRCAHNTGGWVSDHQDCLQCADSLDRKKACGMKVSYVTPGVNYSICHAGLACTAAPCMTPRGVKIEICEGDTLQSGDEWVCCAECPSNCNSSNDQPCGGEMAEMDECSMPPPACR